MVCPVDNTELKSLKREGFNVDYCPKCNGVWLDRGELNRIIEKAKELGGKEYPDIDKIKFPQESTPSFQSPGHFFGRIFNF